MHGLIEPHGGILQNLYLDTSEVAQAKKDAGKLKSWDLTKRQLCDLEMLLDGSFSPLTGFMTQTEYDGVVKNMRLPDKTLWPMPITLDVSQDFATPLAPGDRIALKDPEGRTLAILDVESIWPPDKKKEAKHVFGSTDEAHFGVYFLMNEAGPVYIGGRLTGLEKPRHFDFMQYRLSPTETRSQFERMGWSRVIAFQTRNPMHRAHYELTRRAAAEEEASMLIHPVVGMTKPGDVDYFSRVRCYEQLLQTYPPQTTALGLLPLAMRMGGPREAVWHGIIRKNYGCSHFIVGRDHAGPGDDSNGKPFYGPYEAQELFTKHQEELGITMVPFKMMVYVEERGQYAPIDEVTESETTQNISGTELRRRLREGIEIPEWFSFPGILEELRRTYPPRNRQGFTVFFTGLSGAGKSTLANILLTKLLEVGGRSVTLLDGDIVRKNLSSELGFSKEHRNLNVERIGFVASEITKAGGIAVCAPIAPYSDTRRQVRDTVSEYGPFIEVHVSTPLSVCEARDTKGLYAKARAGEIKQFTGIDDPYEEPENAEVVMDTTEDTPEACVHEILLKLKSFGLID